MRCLVIEDELETSRYVCKGLKEAGYSAVACSNGHDGLAQALGERWDIVILDRMLPGALDGLSVIERMRGAGSRTPTIILSALGNLDERVAGLRGGTALALQPREYRLLEYLMRHEGQVVTRTMLLEAVWDYHFDPQTNVIDVQISRLRAKVDRDFAPQLIHTLRGVGYRLGVMAGTPDA